MPRSRPNKSAPPVSQLRIIGGEWRGRKVQFAALEGLRPTGDRLRETLFNWLQFDVVGARCLDLFAGSGALGLEALSRGAQSVDFVELNRTAADLLRRQLQILNAGNAQVHPLPAEQFLALHANGTYDLIFLDPPFAGDLWQPILAQLHPLLARDGLVYVETPRDTALALSGDWEIAKEKRSGQVCMRLLRAAG